MALAGKRIGVTGGAGFIGSHLVERLLEQNEVVVYDNLHRNALQFAHVERHEHLHFVQGDVLDLAATTRALAGCNIVIHCAAIAGVYSVVKSSVRTMEVNLLGTNTAIHAALSAGVERFVDFSTSEVYGAFVHNAKESEPTALGPVGEARWVYAASKLASEHLSFAHHLESGLPLAIVRPFNVYGPRQLIKHDRQGFIGWFIRTAIEDKTIHIYGDGSQLRDLVFVDDAADAFLRAGALDACNGDVFNVGGAQPISLRDLAAELVTIAASGRVEFVGWPDDKKAIDIGSFYADSTKFTRVTGWTPVVQLSDGLRATVDFYRQYLSRYIDESNVAGRP